MAGASGLSRRGLLQALGAAGLAVCAAGCASPYEGLRLRIAAGSPQGVYNRLAGRWPTPGATGCGSRRDPRSW